MSVLVVGLSHRSAPVEVLEQVARDAEGTAKLIRSVIDVDHVVEATALSTCNRVEVYAEVDRFHGSVEAISGLVLERVTEEAEGLLSYLYIHYDDGAVSHLFHVASGLDSMVIGESQILGQTREALRAGQEATTIGPSLNTLFQQALRVGKRAHAETDIDRSGRSLVTAALDIAGEHVGVIEGKRALVVGAGSMASLAVSTLRRAGIGDLIIANRTPVRGQRLAEKYDGRAVSLAELPTELASADLLISCTGSTGVLIPADMVRAATRNAPLAVIDLALPHDVDPDVGSLAGVRLTTLQNLAAALPEVGEPSGADAVREIVADELDAFLSLRRSASVTPTLVALRSMATGVVEAELGRLESRLPELDPQARAELEQTVRRVAEKLLHQPTVRVKELVNDRGAVSYAEALADLFALHPDAVEAVTRPEALS